MKTEEVLEVLGISRQRLQQIAKAGYVERVKRGCYNRNSVMEYKDGLRKKKSPKTFETLTELRKSLESTLQILSEEDIERLNKLAVSSLEKNLAEDDAAITKFFLQNTNEEFMTSEERLSRQVIHHIAEY